MTLRDTTERVREMFATGKPFTDRVRFDFGSEGVISVNGATQPPTVSNESIACKCTIVMSLADFDRMLARELDPQMAFMTGKLSVKGRPGVAMNLVTLLSG